MIDKLEVGGTVVLSDGSAAPKGEHILADGTSMQVDEAGVILEVAIPAEDMQPEEMPVEEMKKKMDDYAAEFQAKVDILNFEKEELQTKLKVLTEKTTQGFSQVLSLIEDMAKVPSADPIAKPNSFKYQDTKDLKYDRIEKYRQAILNNKN
jgi:anion-transporting  ArsA/GET3 family ATPase